MKYGLQIESLFIINIYVNITPQSTVELGLLPLEVILTSWQSGDRFYGRADVTLSSGFYFWLVASKVDEILGHLLGDAHHYGCHDNGVQERDDLTGLKQKKKPRKYGKVMILLAL